MFRLKSLNATQTLDVHELRHMGGAKVITLQYDVSMDVAQPMNVRPDYLRVLGGSWKHRNA